MTSWLERARNEIPKSAARPTANTADIHISSVTAVPKAGDSGYMHGILLSELRELAGQDWPECERDPVLLDTYARSIQVRRMRERGIVPAHYTASTTCAHCGPVLIFPGAPERVLSCPWCFNRVAGRPVPHE
jgi:hypothetical protein